MMKQFYFWHILTHIKFTPFFLKRKRFKIETRCWSLRVPSTIQLFFLEVKPWTFLMMSWSKTRWPRKGKTSTQSCLAEGHLSLTWGFFSFPRLIFFFLLILVRLIQKKDLSHKKPVFQRHSMGPTCWGLQTESLACFDLVLEGASH